MFEVLSSESVNCTALSAPKEHWLDIATIRLCCYFIRMTK